MALVGRPYTLVSVKIREGNFKSSNAIYYASSAVRHSLSNAIYIGLLSTFFFTDCWVIIFKNSKVDFLGGLGIIKSRLAYWRKWNVLLVTINYLSWPYAPDFRPAYSRAFIQSWHRFPVGVPLIKIKWTSHRSIILMNILIYGMCCNL